MPLLPARRKRSPNPSLNTNLLTSVTASLRRRNSKSAPPNSAYRPTFSKARRRSISIGSRPSLDGESSGDKTPPPFEVEIDSDDERDDEMHMTVEENEVMDGLRMEFTQGPSAVQRVKMGAVVVPNRGLCLLPLAFWRFGWCGGDFSAADVRLLDLRGNGLRLLSRKVGKMRGLRALLLGGNELESVPEEIGNLTELRWLDFNSNRLRKLPDVFGKLNKLEELNLEGNMLQSKNFPKSITGASRSLKKLRLRDNDFREVPNTFCKLSMLQELDMRDNEITFIPKGLFSLKHLEKILVRGGNDIANLPAQNFSRGRTSLDVSSGQTLDITTNSFLDSSGGGIPRLVRGYSFHAVTPIHQGPLETETEIISIRKPRVAHTPHLSN